MALSVSKIITFHFSKTEMKPKAHNYFVTPPCYTACARTHKKLLEWFHYWNSCRRMQQFSTKLLRKFASCVILFSIIRGLLTHSVFLSGTGGKRWRHGWQTNDARVNSTTTISRLDYLLWCWSVIRSQMICLPLPDCAENWHGALAATLESAGFFCLEVGTLYTKQSHAFLITLHCAAVTWWSCNVMCGKISSVQAS